MLGYLLSWASDKGHLKVVRYLHRVGVELNICDDEPLCRACDGGHLDVVRYLHQNGGKIFTRDNEPLCRAAAAGHLELVSYIHQNMGDISARENEPLRCAAAGKHVSVVRYLHEAGAATQLLTANARHSIDQMKHEMQAAPAVDHPSAFWKGMGEVNERILGWSGEGNFKRTLNQNYFNFIPIAPDEPRMVRLRRLVPDFTQNILDRYLVDDPDRNSNSWMSFYPNYYIFKDPDRSKKRELYREYLALMYEYALRRDRSGLLASLDEPTLGNPIGVHRCGRLISQDLVNSVRERNSIIAAMEKSADTHFTLGELGAGYGRLGYVLLKTTKWRYFVFDIPPALYVSQWYLTNSISQPPRLSISPLRHVRRDRERVVSSRNRFLYSQSVDEISSPLFRSICEHQLTPRDAARSNHSLYGTYGAGNEVRALFETAERLRESHRWPRDWHERLPSTVKMGAEPGAFRSDQSGFFRTNLSKEPPHTSRGLISFCRLESTKNQGAVQGRIPNFWPLTIGTS